MPQICQTYHHNNMYPQLTHGMFALWQPNALGTGSDDLIKQESWAVSQMISMLLRWRSWASFDENIWALIRTILPEVLIAQMWKQAVNKSSYQGFGPEKSESVVVFFFFNTPGGTALRAAQTSPSLAPGPSTTVSNSSQVPGNFNFSSPFNHIFYF